jgi:NAD(P)-dependent dehydrogenase (short-subunit alcohol dehydrogenase family)
MEGLKRMSSFASAAAAPAETVAAPNSRVWFISNLTRGFGIELVRQVLARGDKVVATAADIDQVIEAFPEGDAGLLALSLDLADPEQVQYAVAQAVGHFGRIDLLINNASMGVLGAIEEISDMEILQAVEGNLLGVIRMTRAVLPQMRLQRSGQIVNMSTFATAGEGPGWGVYAATKSAIDGLSEVLAEEVGPLGIGVTLLEPVPFRSDFMIDSLIVGKQVIDDYYDTSGRTRRRQGVPLGNPAYYPLAGVSSVIEALTAEKPPLHLVLGHKGYYRALKKLESLRQEHMAWHDVSLAMDHIL